MDLFRWHLVSTMKISLTMLTLDSFLKFKYVLDDLTEKTCWYNPVSDLFIMTKKLLCNFFNRLQFDEKILYLSEFQICTRWFRGKNLKIQSKRPFSITRMLLCSFLNRLQFDEKISCLSEIQICTRWFHGNSNDKSVDLKFF